jgi:hypothetical protein
MLARELALPVDRWYGLYRLDEAIVAGSGTILEQAGIPFAPAGHCFLVYNNLRIDLTAGNNNGKKKEIDDFLAIWPDPPGPHASLNRILCDEFDRQLLAEDPAFRHLSLEQLKQVRAQCMSQMRRNREATPHREELATAM